MNERINNIVGDEVSKFKIENSLSCKEMGKVMNAKTSDIYYWRLGKLIPSIFFQNWDKEEIADLRKVAKVTKALFAKHLCISVSRLSSLENGTSTPNEALCVRLHLYSCLVRYTLIEN